MSLNDEALNEDKDTIEEGQENTNTMQKEQDMTQDDIREVDEQEDLINEEESKGSFFILSNVMIFML